MEGGKIEILHYLCHMLNQKFSDMKKIKLFFTILMLLFTTNTFAQKSYVEINSSTNYIYIRGDIPTNLEGWEYRNNKSGIYAYISYDRMSFVDVINLLIQEGYTLEQYSVLYSSQFEHYALMSKNSSSASSIQNIQSDADEDGDIREVARYNLQGMPIGKHEKGIQIIVYSNYTTKTVIVE